jgi:hypothetical protein
VQVQILSSAFTFKAMKLYEYKIENTAATHFPLDLLRYEESWPARQEDSKSIELLLRGQVSSTIQWCILLQGLHCSPEKWKEFGWKVIEQRRING